MFQLKGKKIRMLVVDLLESLGFLNSKAGFATAPTRVIKINGVGMGKCTLENAEGYMSAVLNL